MICKTFCSYCKTSKYEIRIGCLSLNEELDKKNKVISIKATTSNTKVKKEKSNKEESYSSNIDDETMTLLVNKFSKFQNKKGGFIKFQRRDTRDSTKGASTQKTKSLDMNGGRVENDKDIRDLKAKKAFTMLDT
ncbi:hypothetical protein Lal_00014109 [Lupinus albus]|nr:hypothetical protein Lal_00014109 [Lupinus albus]